MKIDLPMEEIIEKIKKGISQKELAKEYGVSQSKISNEIQIYCILAGIDKPVLSRRKKELPMEEIIEKRNNGIKEKELAKKYGVSQTTISNEIQTYCILVGIDKPVLSTKKKELPVEEIIKKREEGISQKELAEEYEVSQSTISNEIQEYYTSRGEKKPKILRTTSIIKDYLKRGIPIEEIRQIAYKSGIIIPEITIKEAKDEIVKEEIER